MEPSDRDLLERWRMGDTASGEVLFERYYNMVEQFFLSRVSDGVQDLVQETFIRCVESRERIHDNDQFRGYMFGVAYHVLSANLRERYRGKRAIDCDEVSVHDLAPGPRTLMAQRREHRLLIEALHNIPVDDQVILELHYWEQLTTHQMAEVLGIPIGTARGRLQRARTRLEAMMLCLAESPQEPSSALQRLEDWVAGCRERLGSYRVEDRTIAV